MGLPLLAGAAIGGLLASKGGKVSAPAPRDYYDEGRDTLQAQIDLAPALLKAERETRPAYAQLDTDILKQILPQVSELEATATTAQRTADIGDVEALGARATEAFRSANPQLAGIQDTLTARAQAGGGSAINDYLKQDALADLKRGGALSPDEERDVAQSARAAFNARGIARSDPGMFGEVLNRSRYANARLAERRQNAMAVDSQSLQREQYDSNLLGTTGQFLSQTSSDPFQAILGRSAAPGGVQGAGFSLQSAPTIYNPFDPYAGALNASNQQNIMDARTATAANRAAITGSLLSAVGSFAGAAAGACWVARAVYGAESPNWMAFRWWLRTAAPGWFRRLYLARGEGFAAWLEAHKWAKVPVRRAMEWILNRCERRAAA